VIAVPRTRRRGALLTAVISIAAFTAVGCGSGGSTSSSSGSSSSSSNNVSPGTYTVTIDATSGNLVHSTVLTLTVTQ
jgi:ABC-type glycerol-3-phosphate transport system substrate-binding protein